MTNYKFKKLNYEITRVIKLNAKIYVCVSKYNLVLHG